MHTILIVEDHPLVVEGLVRIIENAHGLSVAGIARNADECLVLLEKCTPSLILLDISLPGNNGIELCKIITAKPDRPKIIAISAYNQRYYVDSMLNSGANGYLLKNSSAEEIPLAIHQVMQGRTYLSEDVEKMIKNHPENPLLLSRREIEVLKLISDGFTNKEIADRLFISILTVDSHRKNLIQKMGVKNTAALVKIAGVEGII